MQKRILIMGIDPATTKAYAVLDIDGNPIKLSSSKELSLNQLVE